MNATEWAEAFDRIDSNLKATEAIAQNALARNALLKVEIKDLKFALEMEHLVAQHFMDANDQLEEECARLRVLLREHDIEQ